MTLETWKQKGIFSFGSMTNDDKQILFATGGSKSRFETSFHEGKQVPSSGSGMFSFGTMASKEKEISNRRKVRAVRRATDAPVFAFMGTFGSTCTRSSGSTDIVPPSSSKMPSSGGMPSSVTVNTPLVVTWEDDSWDQGSISESHVTEDMDEEGEPLDPLEKRLQAASYFLEASQAEALTNDQYNEVLAVIKVGLEILKGGTSGEKRRKTIKRLDDLMDDVAKCLS